MGLESAERNLLAAMRMKADDLSIDLRVVGGRAARRYARALNAQWVPSAPGHLPRRAIRRADLAHLLALDMPPPHDAAFILTIHDIAGLVYDDEQQLPSWTGSALHNAQGILTPSRFTADEIARRFPIPAEKLHVIGTGLGLSVSPTSQGLLAKDRSGLGLTNPYILRLGGYTRRKNLAVLLDAWPVIREVTKLSLVLVGAPIPARDDALKAAPDLRGVHVFDYLSATMTTRLLRSATALVSTSTYEGVGLPPLEAMQAGVPVVAIRSQALIEFCGDAVAVAQNDATSFSHVVCEVASDDALRQTLVTRGLAQVSQYSWEAVADCVTNAYRQCLLSMKSEDQPISTAL